MIGRKRRPSSTLILVLILLVLLPFLAYKQYDWLGKVSESEREQMLVNMRSAADRFRDDFDREITRIHSSFQLGGEGSTLKSQAAGQYAIWEREAPYPKLIENVFLITQPLDTAREVERLDPSTLNFATMDWPDQLTPLRRPRSLTTFQLGRNLPIADHFEQVFIVNGPVNPTIPAVVIQVMPELPAGAGVIEFPRALAQLVVTLNRDYIQKEFIPTIVKRDLAGTDGVLDYIVSVVENSDARPVVYSSESGAPADSADVTIGILSTRPADFRLAAGTRTAITASASRDVFQKRVNGKLTVQVLQGAAGMRGVLRSALTDGAWQLALTHRAGSLDAAVAQTRQRNLAISFSILLILSLSVGLILISAQRERRLARQQLEFVSAVSHELRTPLAVICSAGENLADGVVDSEEQTRQYGALVRNEGRRLSEMVEQVLDFAGIQSGRNAYRLEAAEVSEIVDQAIEIFAMQIRDAGLTLDKHIEPNLPPIKADRSAMIRAIQNLIGNALKYGGQGNWLSVRAEAAGTDVLISVEDRGGGISPVDLPHIFEPFYRAASVVDAQIKGSGLGLALVKQIVDAHHAKINVDSTLQKGTAFTIVVPAMDRAVSGVVTHDQAYSPR